MRFIITTIFLFSLNFLLHSQKDNKNNRDIVGTWHGKLKIDESKFLNVLFHFSYDNKKNIVAFMDSPDQGAFNMELENIRLLLKYIKFELPAFKISYRGKFITKDSIVGEFSQGKFISELILQKETSNAIGFKRPQEPKPPFIYKSEEVSFFNANSNINLKGTLTYPKGKGQFPSVILISGSGPQDRNEEILGHKPFLVIADYLTKNGIAVLRYDDRGVKKSSGDYNTATSSDFALDAMSAYNFLKNHKKIDKNKIGLIGHSEGGMIAQMLASSDKNIAFVVLLASPGIPIKDLMIKQTEEALKMSGIKESEIKVSVELNNKFYNLILNNDNNEFCKKEIENIIKNHSNSLPKSEADELIKKTPFIIKSLLSPWFKYFIRFNPENYLKDITCPVLALNGEKDVQVYYNDNLNNIKKIINNNNNYKVETISFPNLNHLFQNCETGAVSEYSQIEETFSYDVLKLIVEWIKKN